MSSVSMVQTNRVLGQVLSKLSQHEKALELLEQSVAMANEMGMEHDEALSIIAYIKAAINAEKVTPSRSALIPRAIDILTKIGAKLDLEEARKLAAKFQ